MDGHPAVEGGQRFFEIRWRTNPANHKELAPAELDEQTEPRLAQDFQRVRASLGFDASWSGMLLKPWLMDASSQPDSPMRTCLQTPPNSKLEFESFHKAQTGEYHAVIHGLGLLDVILLTKFSDWKIEIGVLKPLPSFLQTLRADSAWVSAPSPSFQQPPKPALRAPC